MPIPYKLLSGPIGSSLPTLGITRSGMAVMAQRSDSMPETEAREYFKVEHYDSDTTIYKAGDAGDRVFLVKGGRVRLVHAAWNGTRSVVGILKVGDVFGADPFRLEASTAQEAAIAAEAAEVWSIDAREFRAQLESRPVLAVEVFKAYAERVRVLQQRVLALTFKEVPARLAEMILTLANAHGDPCPHGGETDLRGVTQQDLADLVGASRSFVSTLINEMKRDGLLGNVGRTLCLRDRRALGKIAALEK
jgi:CRP/FNR family transcriptional regulator, cyclic AMP receptor protein